MKPSEVLKVNRELMRARLVRNPGCFAEYTNGDRCWYDNPGAHRFCIVGGLAAMQSRGLISDSAESAAIAYLDRKNRKSSLFEATRDGRRSVISLHDRAIALAESEGQ